jgi:hypothetical protein
MVGDHRLDPVRGAQLLWRVLPQYRR